MNVTADVGVVVADGDEVEDDWSRSHVVGRVDLAGQLSNVRRSAGGGAPPGVP